MDISSASARVALDLLKTILYDTTVRRSTVDQEDLKPYWKSEKRSQNNDWVFVYELSSCGFKYHCCDLYLDCFKCFKLHYASKSKVFLFLSLATNTGIQ